MSEETEARFDSVNEKLPHIGDQIVQVLSTALGEPVAIVLHVILPSTGHVMMTTNMPDEALAGFMADAADELRDGNYTTRQVETMQ